MSARTIAGLTLGIVILGILGATIWQRYEPLPGERSILVPLQVRAPVPESAGDCQDMDPFPVAPDQHDLLRLVRSARPVADWPLASVQRFADQLLEHREVFAPCESALRVMTYAREALHRLQDADDTERAVRICFGLRWSLPRINEIADQCAGLLDRTRTTSDAAAFARDDQAFELQGIDRALFRRTRDYLANPYCPERTRALALALSGNEYRDIADRLAAELLQLDTEAAARLEHELASLDPLPYPGFRFQ